MGYELAGRLPAFTTQMFTKGVGLSSVKLSGQLRETMYCCDYQQHVYVIIT